MCCRTRNTPLAKTDYASYDFQKTFSPIVSKSQGVFLMKKRLLVVTVAAFCGQQALAEGNGPTVAFELPFLEQTTTNFETKRDSVDEKQKEEDTDLKTANIDAAVVYATWNKYRLYANPFAADTKMVGAGYLVTPALEKKL
jgi:hypothetical protein